jgi:Caudovirus prohead serine protease
MIRLARSLVTFSQVSGISSSHALSTTLRSYGSLRLAVQRQSRRMETQDLKSSHTLNSGTALRRPSYRMESSSARGETTTTYCRYSEKAIESARNFNPSEANSAIVSSCARSWFKHAPRIRGLRLGQRGHIRECSFSFTAQEETWTDERIDGTLVPVRTLRDVDLYDVGLSHTPLIHKRLCRLAAPMAEGAETPWRLIRATGRSSPRRSGLD